MKFQNVDQILKKMLAKKVQNTHDTRSGFEIRTKQMTFFTIQIACTRGHCVLARFRARFFLRFRLSTRASSLAYSRLRARNSTTHLALRRFTVFACNACDTSYFRDGSISSTPLPWHTTFISDISNVESVNKKTKKTSSMVTKTNTKMAS